MGPDILFQSAPPHGERLVGVVGKLIGGYVSIRAPARGATLTNAGRGRSSVSIRAPARGATLRQVTRPTFRGCFNPRPRTGSDTRVRIFPSSSMFQSAPPHGERHSRYRHLRNFGVSIRAPARGATRIVEAHAQIVSIRAPARGATLSFYLHGCSSSFNPRPRTGSDALARAMAYAAFSMFQSAPPHGERRHDIPYPHSTMSFNPRPRTGSDVLTLTATTHRHCFNPRPRTGSDFRLAFSVGLRQVSIRAPARGATRESCLARHLQCFNPRPRTGSDMACRARSAILVSIRAPARGATRDDRQKSAPTSCFNPRPRTGSDLRRCRQPRILLFQSAPPHGERRFHSLMMLMLGGRFNPRPRTGSDR